ncbi:27065_t:CDS:2, partial [Racocetra persica]
ILTYNASAQLVNVTSPEAGSTIHKPFYGKVAWKYNNNLRDSVVNVSILGYHCNVPACTPVFTSYWSQTT